MTTIEERASTAHLRSETKPLTIASAHAVGYIQGASEQRKIDIEKACEWLYKCVGTGEQFKKTLVEKFRKAMEL